MVVAWVLELNISSATTLILSNYVSYLLIQNVWWCSICRRKLQSRTQPVMPQDSTESLLDVPVLEALQRRHSDVKIGSSSLGVGGGSALAPPRSPELRRHSDVSPASLKEIEKVKEKVRAGFLFSNNTVICSRTVLTPYYFLLIFMNQCKSSLLMWLLHGHL